VSGGQFYHRPGHLIIDSARRMTVAEAEAMGLAPCPECDPGLAASGYYRQLQSDRSGGQSYGGLAVPDAAGVPAEPATGPAPAASPAAAAPRRASYADDLPADGIPVPGTNGTLKVPTFKGSNAIIAVPLNSAPGYSGYTVVQPNFASPSANPPASSSH